MFNIMLKEILSDEQLNSLFEALLENKEFNLDTDGLSIKYLPEGDNYNFSIRYNNEDNQARKEAKEFMDYLNNLDDSVFLEVCESMPEGHLHDLSDSLQKGSLEEVRKAIMAFKNLIRTYLVNKINSLKTCLNKLDK